MKKNVKNDIQIYEIPYTLKENFSLDNNCLTQKLTMKRNIIEEKYRNIIESLYL